MKISVLNDDNTLGIDGLFFSGLDFSGVPDNVYALQWKEVKGEIEFYEDENGTKEPNEKITELPEWVSLLFPQWNSAKAIKEQEEAAFQQEVEAHAVLAKQMEEAAKAEQELVDTSVSLPTIGGSV